MTRKVEQGALVAAIVAAVAALAFVFGIKESVAVQGKEIEGVQGKYEYVVSLIFTRLDRIERKIDSLGGSHDRTSP